MSVLSNPQGTPERVWSLIAGLSALGGTAPRETYDGLLNPGYDREDGEVRANPSLAANAHGAALSLKLVEANRDQAALISAPEDFLAFADLVHDHLAALPAGEPDAPILEAFAWMAAESDKRGNLEWIYQTGRDEFVDNANAALIGEDEDGKIMNPTKAVAWRRWLSFMGLGVTMPTDRGAPDFPTPAARIVRELKRAAIAPGTVMPASEFITLLAKRMPYLDRGQLYTQACQRIDHNSGSSRLSPLLSVALRDLHDENILKLTPSGDAADRVRLSEDSAHPIDAFTTIELFPESKP